MKHKTVRINTASGKVKIIILEERNNKEIVPGILWIHGGGYVTGMASMVYVSAGRLLAKTYGGVVLSPGYRLAPIHPYPAALEDCYAALEFLFEHAEELGIDKEKIIVGGESAGGGLTAALCLYARDQGKIRVRMQIPLYPMIDCFDTPSSIDNHGRVWNTRRNHFGWKAYLKDLYGRKDIPVYASAAREDNYEGMPPCYTFVQDGEPFYQETLDYVEKLKRSGVKASVDVYHGDVHAFDLLTPWTKSAKAAREKLCKEYEKIIVEAPE